MPVNLRRVPSDKPWANDVNRIIDYLIGNRDGGQLDVTDDTGQRIGLDGTVTASGQYAVTIASGINKALKVQGGAELAGTETLGSILTPASLSVNTNDYAPSGHETARVVALVASAAINLSGFQSSGSATGRIVTFRNTSTFVITLLHDSALSSASNRFLLPGAANLALSTNSAVTLQFTGSRWAYLQ